EAVITIARDHEPSARLAARSRRIGERHYNRPLQQAEYPRHILGERRVSKKSFLITGCVRCGTSMVTQIVAKMGVSVSSSLKPADKANQRGYWEDTFVLEVHKSLLRSLGREGVGGSTIPMPTGWLNDIRTKDAKKCLLEYVHGCVGN